MLYVLLTNNMLVCWLFSIIILIVSVAAGVIVYMIVK